MTLALFDYSDRISETKWNQTLDKVGQAFTVIFTLEAVIKIISMGFVMGKKTYLRDGWNVIDFFVVLSGILELFPSGSLNLKSLRTVRVIRPLRSINAIPSMRKLVLALIMTIPNFANVTLFLLFVFVMFSILGLHSFSTVVFNACRLTPAPINATYWPKLNDNRVCSTDGLGNYQCPEGTFCGDP